MQILKVENLSKIYGSGETAVKALDNISFSVSKGEFIAIVGPSGSGKSTLLHILGGVDVPTKGKVIVDNTDVYAMDETALAIFRRRQIGLIYQFYNLIPVLDVTENITLPLLLDGRKVDQDNFNNIIKILGLQERLTHLPNQLSGGQQQRVALARTLNQNPSIILADEPVAALDPVTANQVMSDFKRINQEMNITILINIHHVDLALDYADRVIGIRAGEIVYDGPVKDVTQDVLDIIYNGAPIPKAADEQSSKDAAIIAQAKANMESAQSVCSKEAQA